MRLRVPLKEEEGTLPVHIYAQLLTGLPIFPRNLTMSIQGKNIKWYDNNQTRTENQQTNQPWLDFITW